MSSDAPSADWQLLQSAFLRYRAGDAQATRDLFGDIAHRLKPFFRSRCGSDEDAEDLTQATLLKIHFARERFDPAQSLKTWVFTIAGRSLIDHWRGRAAESSVLDQLDTADDGDAADTGPGPDQRLEWNRDLRAALNHLKPIDRSIVYLYGVEGFSMGEIAKMLGLTEAATKLRAHRSYKDLRRILALLCLIFWRLR